MAEIEVLTVHYQTPDLLVRLLGSVNTLYEGVRTIVVDGSDQKEFIENTRAVVDAHKNVHLCQLGYNIGHGIGLVHGTKHATAPYVYMMDSDDYFIRAGLFDVLVPMINQGVYGVGRIFKLKRHITMDNGDIPMLYMHPSGMLINMSEFTKYKLPRDHGAPMIGVMQDMQDRGVDETAMVNFDALYDYMARTKRGTTTRWPLLVNETYRAKTAKDGPCSVWSGAS